VCLPNGHWDPKYDGDQARFAWSTDGETFRQFGPTFTIKFGKWTGDRLGLFCWNYRESEGHVDVDWQAFTTVVQRIRKHLHDRVVWLRPSDVTDRYHPVDSAGCR